VRTQQPEPGPDTVQNVMGILWWIGDLVSLTFVVCQLEDSWRQPLAHSSQSHQCQNSQLQWFWHYHHGDWYVLHEAQTGSTGEHENCKWIYGWEGGLISAGTFWVRIGREFSKPVVDQRACQSTLNPLRRNKKNKLCGQSWAYSKEPTWMFL